MCYKEIDHTIPWENSFPVTKFWSKKWPFCDKNTKVNKSVINIGKLTSPFLSPKISSPKISSGNRCLQTKRAKIEDGSWTTNDLFQPFLICFADLKKYHYYYWDRSK